MTNTLNTNKLKLAPEDKKIIASSKINSDYFENKKNNTARNIGNQEIKSFQTDKKERLFSLADSNDKVEDHEKLMTEQLKILKQEIKDITKERDNYKKMYEDSIKLKEQNQLISTLKQTVENLLLEINITGKIKDYAILIMKILDFSDISQKKVLEKKKKGLIGIFS